MEEELILCDTDVMVEFFKKNIPVLQLMNELEPEIFLSALSLKLNYSKARGTKSK